MLYFVQNFDKMIALDWDKDMKLQTFCQKIPFALVQRVVSRPLQPLARMATACDLKTQSCHVNCDTSLLLVVLESKTSKAFATQHQLRGPTNPTTMFFLLFARLVASRKQKQNTELARFGFTFEDLL